MRFSYSPTFRDQYLSSLAVTYSSPLLTLLSLLFPGMGIYILITTLQHGRLPSWSESLLILWCFAFTPLLTAYSIWMARRRNKTARGPQTYSFTEEGLSIQGGTFNVNLNWDAINRVRETKRYFLFYISAYNAYALPKKVIDQTNFDSLRNLFKKVGNSKG